MSAHKQRYKNVGLDSTEMRRRREEEGIQLRKQKREQQLIKRRNVDNFPTMDGDNDCSVTVSENFYRWLTLFNWFWWCCCCRKCRSMRQMDKLIVIWSPICTVIKRIINCERSRNSGNCCRETQIHPLTMSFKQESCPVLLISCETITIPHSR